MSDYASQAVYIGKFLTEQGYLINDQVILKQGSKSTIALVRKGRSAAKTTRLINLLFLAL
jgi:hypothetical protein